MQTNPPHMQKSIPQDHERMLQQQPHKLRIGLFGGNLSGIGMTAIPERWQAQWSDNVAVAQLADAAGIDFLLPVARWKGYEGATNPQGTSLEPITWAAGLLAITKRINIFATVHIPLIHPAFAAKQFVTADHIGSGRFGLNVVCGWNDEEFEMFGTRRETTERYQQAAEWLDIVKGLWSSPKPFDYAGKYYTSPRLYAEPKPFGGSRPLLVNAGVSPEGIAFALGNCDILFSTAPRDGHFAAWAPTVQHIRAQAGKANFPIFTNCVVTCRRTRAEAEDFHRYCYSIIDNEALDIILAMRARAGKPVPPGDISQMRHQASKATAPYLIGNPDDIATGLAQLQAAGADGVAIMLTNQLDELPLLIEEVLPRLERLGLRQTCRFN